MTGMTFEQAALVLALLDLKPADQACRAALEALGGYIVGIFANATHDCKPLANAGSEGWARIWDRVEIGPRRAR